MRLGLSCSPVEVMEELARIKLNGAVMPSPNYPLVVADTAVWLDGELLGKPIDTDDAARMLEASLAQFIMCCLQSG